MSFPSDFLTLLLVFLISASSTPSVNGGNDLPSAYEVLQQYDFPIGILPKGVVTGYKIDYSTGKFSLYLNGSCSFNIESYALKYKSTISGVLTKGRIHNLKGIQVKVLLLWLNIVEVSRDGDELDFSVGIASADFPNDSFYESPSCGCGFDCVGDINKLDNLAFSS